MDDKASKRGRNNRAKGAQFERDVAERLRAIFPGARRTIGQARTGAEAPDVDGTPYWIECGMGAHVTAEKKLAQAIADEMQQDTRRPPVAVTRKPRGDAMVTMRWEDFLELVRSRHADRVPSVPRTCEARPADGAEASMTDADIDELEKALAAATAGPWKRCGASDGNCQCSLVWTPDGQALVHASPTPDEGIPAASESRENANLIALLRNAAPALLTELRRLRASEAEAEVRGATWALENEYPDDPAEYARNTALTICAARRPR